MRSSSFYRLPTSNQNSRRNSYSKILVQNPMVQSNLMNTSRALMYEHFPVGLKNISNNSLLNSIIQFLFALQPVRNQLCSIYEHHEKMDSAKFSKLLGKLFSYLKSKSKDSRRIQQILLLMTHCLHSQDNQDPIQALLNIFQHISEKHTQILKFLDIKYRSQCCCGYFVSTQKIFFYSPNKCKVCNQFITKKILNQPKYIIYSNGKNNRVQSQIQQQLQITNQNIKQDQRLFYKLKAQIINVNGRYIAYRVDDGKQFWLNDQSVYEFRTHQQNGLVLLYQLFNKQLIPQCRPTSIQVHNIGNKLVKIQRKPFLPDKPLLLKSNTPIRSKLESSPRNRKTLRQEQSHKLVIGKVYQFKIKLLNRALSIFISIIKEMNCYELAILNIGIILFPQFQDQFHSFYNSIVQNQSPNQLQRVGNYLKDFISKANLKTSEQRKYLWINGQVHPTNLIADLIYNFQANTIQVNRLKEDQSANTTK